MEPFIPNKTAKHKDPDVSIVQGNFQSSIFPQNKSTTSCVSLLPSGGRVIQNNGAQNQQKLVSHKANTTTLSLLPSSVRVLTSKDGKSQHTVSLQDKVTTTGVTRLPSSIRVITTNAPQSPTCTCFTNKYNKWFILNATWDESYYRKCCPKSTCTSHTE